MAVSFGVRNPYILSVVVLERTRPLLCWRALVRVLTTVCVCDLSGFHLRPAPASRHAAGELAVVVHHVLLHAAGDPALRS
jgi:hypothetical protein